MIAVQIKLKIRKVIWNYRIDELINEKILWIVII